MVNGRIMRDIKIFISSSQSELKDERELLETIIKDIKPNINLVPILAENFPPKSRKDEHLIKVNESDIVVVLLKNSIKTPVMDEISEAIKKHKPLLFFLKKREKRNDDLLNVISEIRNHFRYKSFSSLDFKKDLSSSLLDEIRDDFFSTPQSYTNMPKMYEHSIGIMENAKRHLYIVQRTSSILFDPRPGLEEDALFCNGLNVWLKDNISDNQDRLISPKCICLYSVEHTKAKIDEIKKNGEYDDINKIKERLILAKDYEKQSNFKFRLFSVIQYKDCFTNPFIIGDSEFGVWFMIGKTNMGLSQKNSDITSNWVSHIDDMLLQEEIERGRRKNIFEHLSEVGLPVKFGVKSISLKNDINDHIHADQMPGHNISHLLRVYDMGLILSQFEKINLDILEPALLLHDIRYPKGKEKDHMALSAKYAKQILPQYHYDDVEINEISACILNHSSLVHVSDNNKSLESRILYDADKCDGVGIDGINRIIKMLGNNNKAAKNYLERIIEIKIADRIYTDMARKIINQRIPYSLDWCHRKLKNEYNTILHGHRLNEEDIRFL